jgi:pimeloyl-ACP methyl ester carboxylesterase
MPKTSFVLIPGLTCTEALWAPQMAALGDIADISIGDHRRDATMAAIATRILAAAPARFALSGLSMGGYIAFEILRRAPERVTRLALLDTKATIDPPDRASARRALAEVARRDGMRPVMEQYLPAFLHPARLGETDLTETVIKMGVDTGAQAFALQQEAIIARPDSVATLARITCPTLLLVGRGDVLTPLAEHEAMHRALPGSRLEAVEDCGHLSTLERPDAVSRALRAWLTA